MKLNFLRTSSLLLSLMLYAASLQAQLSLVWPKADMIFQRRSGSAPVKFVVSAVDNQGIGSIQVRFRRYEVYGGTQLTNPVDPRPGGQGMSGDGWITLSLEAGQGTCQVRGQLTVNQGMYQVEARDGSNAGRTAGGVNFGVGEVFAIAGQSNAAGYLKENNQGGLGIDYPTFVKFKNEKDPGYFDSNDPGGSSLPNDRNFVWYWGRVGDGLARQLQVPIAFYQTAISGTGIEDWNSTVNRFPQNFVYHNLQKFLTITAKQTGVRAILWHQGEGNNPNAPFFNDVDYGGQLNSLIQRTRNEGGSSLAWVVAQATYNSGQVDTRPFTVHQFQKRIIGYQAHTDAGFSGIVKDYGDDYPGPFNLSSIFSGPDTDLLTGPTYRLPDLTHFNYNGQSEVAERWRQSLLNAYNGSNFFDRSYPILNDGQVEVNNPTCGGSSTGCFTMAINAYNGDNSKRLGILNGLPKIRNYDAGDNSQIWKLDNVNGYVRISSATNTNLVLGVVGGGATPGNEVELQANSGSDAQQWQQIALTNGSGFYSFTRKNTGNYLTSVYGWGAGNADPNVKDLQLTDNNTYGGSHWNLIAASCPTVGCNPPGLPYPSANPSSVNPNNQVNLTATGCSGTVYWTNAQTGNSVGSGNSIYVYPSTTTTYLAYCQTASDCRSGNSSVTVSVPATPTQPSNGLTQVRAMFRTDNCAVCQDRCTNALVQGSNDNANWTTLATLSRPNSGWNDYAVSGAAAYRYLRYVAAGGCYGELLELEFYSNGTRLTGSPIGGGTPHNNDPGLGYQSALDGNQGTLWHGSGTGPQNYAGLDLGSSPGTTPSCTLPTNACYTINIDKTGKRLQAMGDNTVQQQNTSNASNQIWRLEDRGNGQVSFRSQDGSSRVIQANGTPGSGVGISLGGYSGNNQHWALECNPSSQGQWRVYSSATNNTWDMQGYANDPYLQIYGDRGEGFSTHRSFRFEAATCPSGRQAALPSAESTSTDLAITVYPNPSSGQFTVRFQTTAGQTATLRLSDVSGRPVQAVQNIKGTGGVHEEAVKLPSSVHGLLLLEVSSGPQRATRKLLID